MTPPAPSPLRLQPATAELDRLIDCIEAFAATHGFHPVDTRAFALAAEELFANTILHARPPATVVEFSLACSDGVATATYSDDSSPFDPTLHPAPDTTLSAAERRIGGLGIHFIRITMRDFNYRRDGERNIVTFSRPLTAHSDGSS